MGHRGGHDPRTQASPIVNKTSVSMSMFLNWTTSLKDPIFDSHESSLALVQQLHLDPFSTNPEYQQWLRFRGHRFRLLKIPRYVMFFFFLLRSLGLKFPLFNALETIDPDSGAESTHPFPPFRRASHYSPLCLCASICMLSRREARLAVSKSCGALGVRGDAFDYLI